VPADVETEAKGAEAKAEDNFAELLGAFGGELPGERSKIN